MSTWLWIHFICYSNCLSAFIRILWFDVTNLTALWQPSSDTHLPPLARGSVPRGLVLQGCPDLCSGRSRGPTPTGWSPRWPGCHAPSDLPGWGRWYPRPGGWTSGAERSRRARHLPPCPAPCPNHPTHRPPAGRWENISRRRRARW